MENNLKSNIEEKNLNTTSLTNIFNFCSELTPEILKIAKDYINEGISVQEISEIKEAIKNNPKLSKEMLYTFHEDGFIAGQLFLEHLGAEPYIKKELEPFEKYFKTNNLITERLSNGDIKALLNGNSFTIREDDNFIELEIFKENESFPKFIKKAIITSIEDLDTQLNHFIEKEAIIDGVRLMNPEEGNIQPTILDEEKFLKEMYALIEQLGRKGFSVDVDKSNGSIVVSGFIDKKVYTGEIKLERDLSIFGDITEIKNNKSVFGKCLKKPTNLTELRKTLDEIFPDVNSNFNDNYEVYNKDNKKEEFIINSSFFI